MHFQEQSSLPKKGGVVYVVGGRFPNLHIHTVLVSKARQFFVFSRLLFIKQFIMQYEIKVNLKQTCFGCH